MLHCAILAGPGRRCRSAAEHCGSSDVDLQLRAWGLGVDSMAIGALALLYPQPEEPASDFIKALCCHS